MWRRGGRQLGVECESRTRGSPRDPTARQPLADHTFVLLPTGFSAVPAQVDRLAIQHKPGLTGRLVETILRDSIGFSGHDCGLRISGFW